MPLQSVNYKSKLFIIPCGAGHTCLGFDVCMDRTLALSCEFSAMHNSNPEVFKEASPFLCEYGTPAAYAEYERLCAIGAKLNAETRWRSKVCLTPQLVGLEG